MIARRDEGEERGDRYYLAGIDEAGYGPLLGPLVVGLVTLSHPQAVGPAAPWKMLAPTVGRRRSRKRRVIPVADSKKLYSSSTGDLSRLEESVLAAVACEGDGTPPATFRELLDHLTAARAGYLEEYPWYRGADLELPVDAPALELAGAVRRLRRVIARAGFAVEEVRAIPLEVREFNEVIARTGSKAAVDAEAFGRFLRWLGRRRERAATAVWCDRLGGRERYGPLLYPLFPGARLDILEQEAARQHYCVSWDERALDITFARGGDDLAFPTALASMTAKYVRELHLRLFNRWWRERCGEDLRRTAGYPQDARRFLADVEEQRLELGISRADLVRAR